MRFVFVLFCIFQLLVCSGQNRSTIDSLLRIEKNFRQDSNAVKNYHKIALAFAKTNIDSAFYFLWKGKRISEKINHPYLLARSHYNSYNLIRQTQLPIVLIDTLLAIINDKNVVVQGNLLHAAYLEIGVNYRKVGNSEKSVTYLLKSLKLAQELKSNSRIRNSYNSLANTYSFFGLANRSKEEILRALEMYSNSEKFLDENDWEGIGNMFNNQGVSYFNIGTLQNDSSYYLKAIRYFEKSAKIRNQIADSIGLFNSYQNMGSAYHAISDKYKDLKTNLLSRQYFEKAIAIEKNLNKEISYNTLSNYGVQFLVNGEITSNNKNYLIGLDNLKKAYAGAMKFEDINLCSNITKNIASAYFKIGQNDSAIKYFYKYDDYQAKILDIENKRIADELTVKFDMERKESENNNLKQQAILREEVIAKKSNTIKLMIGASIVMCVLIGMVLVSRQNIKKSRKLIQQQQLETQQQKLLIEEKQKEILSSIKYAKRIQNSLMPTDKYITRIFEKLN
ncbi:MAG: tetratricopeptide repeat protein [Sphingobacteriaceae bacterium]|nr:tetratricopeptide repeat protein [Sphingobacteriaceae bacterium]